MLFLILMLGNFNYLQRLPWTLFGWLEINLFNHDGLQPSPKKAIRQISHSLDFHCVAWCDVAMPSLWLPPRAGCIKENFDVVVRESYVVAATVISEDLGNVILAATQKLHSNDASTALLAVWLAVSYGWSCFQLEGGALLVILAIMHQQSCPLFFLDFC